MSSAEPQVKAKIAKKRAVSYDSEESVRAALWEFFFYLCFLTVTIIVACASHSMYMHFFNKTVDRLFMSRTNKNSEHEPDVRFRELTTTADFWSFLERKFIDDLHGAMPAADDTKKTRSLRYWIPGLLLQSDDDYMAPKSAIDLPNTSSNATRRKRAHESLWIGGIWATSSAKEKRIKREENSTEDESTADPPPSTPSEEGAAENLLFLDTNVVLGPPRLRQIRVKEDSCHVDKIFDKYFKKCYAEYSSSVEVTEGSHLSTTYLSADDTNTISLWGVLATYSGGGFVKELTYEAAQNRDIIKELKAQKWIDRATRLVLVEFTLYNGNTDLFSNVKFIGEMPPIGGVITSAYIHTLKLSSLFLGGNYFILLVAIIFYLFVLFYTVQELKEIRGIGISNYVCILWNLVDLIILILAYLSLVYNIWHPIHAHTLMQRLRDSPDKHLSLDKICFWNIIYHNVMALCVFFVCIKVFRFISFNKSMLQFSTTLRRCSRDLLGFSVMFFIVFLAYAQLGLLLFGTVHKDFRNFTESVLTMIRMVLGDFEYAEIERANRVLGPIYFLSYILLVFFILLNMFLAIINDTYSTVKSEVHGGRNYLKEYLQRGFDILRYRGKPPVGPSPTPTTTPAPSTVPESELEPASNVDDTTTRADSQRLEEKDVLMEYFEEIPTGRDTATITRLTARVAKLEDVLEQLVSDMNKILRRVAPKQRIRRSSQD